MQCSFGRIECLVELLFGELRETGTFRSFHVNSLLCFPNGNQGSVRRVGDARYSRPWLYLKFRTLQTFCRYCTSTCRAISELGRNFSSHCAIPTYYELHIGQRFLVPIVSLRAIESGLVIGKRFSLLDSRRINRETECKWKRSISKPRRVDEAPQLFFLWYSKSEYILLDEFWILNLH